MILTVLACRKPAGQEGKMARKRGQFRSITICLNLLPSLTTKQGNTNGVRVRGNNLKKSIPFISVRNIGDMLNYVPITDHIVI